MSCHIHQPAPIVIGLKITWRAHFGPIINDNVNEIRDVADRAFMKAVADFAEVSLMVAFITCCCSSFNFASNLLMQLTKVSCLMAAKDLVLKDGTSVL